MISWIEYSGYIASRLAAWLAVPTCILCAIAWYFGCGWSCAGGALIGGVLAVIGGTALIVLPQLRRET